MPRGYGTLDPPAATPVRQGLRHSSSAILLRFTIERQFLEVDAFSFRKRSRDPGLADHAGSVREPEMQPWASLQPGAAVSNRLWTKTSVRSEGVTRVSVKTATGIDNPVSSMSRMARRPAEA